MNKNFRTHAKSPFLSESSRLQSGNCMTGEGVTVVSLTTGKQFAACEIEFAAEYGVLA